eukprot:g4576.t1
MTFKTILSLMKKSRIRTVVAGKAEIYGAPLTRKSKKRHHKRLKAVRARKREKEEEASRIHVESINEGKKALTAMDIGLMSDMELEREIKRRERNMRYNASMGDPDDIDDLGEGAIWRGKIESSSPPVLPKKIESKKEFRKRMQKKQEMWRIAQNRGNIKKQNIQVQSTNFWEEGSFSGFGAEDDTQTEFGARYGLEETTITQDDRDITHEYDNDSSSSSENCFDLEAEFALDVVHEDTPSRPTTKVAVQKEKDESLKQNSSYVNNLAPEKEAQSMEYYQQLMSWKEEKIKRFDTDPIFLSQRLQQHGSRDAFEDFLQAQIDKKYSAVIAEAENKTESSELKKEDTAVDKNPNVESSESQQYEEKSETTISEAPVFAKGRKLDISEDPIFAKIRSQMKALEDDLSKGKSSKQLNERKTAFKVKKTFVEEIKENVREMKNREEAKVAMKNREEAKLTAEKAADYLTRVTAMDNLAAASIQALIRGELGRRQVQKLRQALDEKKKAEAEIQLTKEARAKLKAKEEMKTSRRLATKAAKAAKTAEYEAATKEEIAARARRKALIAEPAAQICMRKKADSASRDAESAMLEAKEKIKKAKQLKSIADDAQRHYESFEAAYALIAAETKLTKNSDALQSKDIDDDIAAIRIQSIFRGFSAKQCYIKQLEKQSKPVSVNVTCEEKNNEKLMPWDEGYLELNSELEEHEDGDLHNENNASEDMEMETLRYRLNKRLLESQSYKGKEANDAITNTRIAISPVTNDDPQKTSNEIVLQSPQRILNISNNGDHVDFAAAEKDGRLLDLLRKDRIGPPSLIERRLQRELEQKSKPWKQKSIKVKKNRTRSPQTRKSPRKLSKVEENGEKNNDSIENDALSLFQSEKKDVAAGGGVSAARFSIRQRAIAKLRAESEAEVQAEAFALDLRHFLVSCQLQRYEIAMREEGVAETEDLLSLTQEEASEFAAVLKMRPFESRRLCRRIQSVRELQQRRANRESENGLSSEEEVEQRKLTPEEMAERQAFYAEYSKQLQDWKLSCLRNWDNDSDFRKEREETHGTRAKYSQYLQAEIAKKLGETFARMEVAAQPKPSIANEKKKNKSSFSARDNEVRELKRKLLKAELKVAQQAVKNRRSRLSGTITIPKKKKGGKKHSRNGKRDKIAERFRQDDADRARRYEELEETIRLNVQEKMSNAKNDQKKKERRQLVKNQRLKRKRERQQIEAELRALREKEEEDAEKKRAENFARRRKEEIKRLKAKEREEKELRKLRSRDLSRKQDLDLQLFQDDSLNSFAEDKIAHAAASSAKRIRSPRVRRGRQGIILRKDRAHSPDHWKRKGDKFLEHIDNMTGENSEKKSSSYQRTNSAPDSQSSSIRKHSSVSDIRLKQNRRAAAVAQANERSRKAWKKKSDVKSMIKRAKEDSVLLDAPFDPLAHPTRRRWMRNHSANKSQIIKIRHVDDEVNDIINSK